ncbi:MAG: hypothetical protein ACR2QS_05445 [Woeseiaceae bacterium]
MSKNSSVANQATDVTAPNNKQRLFLAYTLFILVDLAVLNLFDEYWAPVEIDSFTTSFLTAALLQVLLRMTLHVEHKTAEYFKTKGGKGAKGKRLLASWLVIFASKFVILWAIDTVFGEKVLFGGVIPFIVVVVTIILTEAVLSKIYAMLGDESAND